jgi:hypothetical protein
MNELKDFLIERQKAITYLIITFMTIGIIYGLLRIDAIPMLGGLSGGRTIIIQSLTVNSSQRVSIYPNREIYVNEEKRQFSLEQWSIVVAQKENWCSRSPQTEELPTSSDLYKVDVSCGLLHIKTLIVPYDEVSYYFS